MSQIQIKLKRGVAGQPKPVRDVIKGLGLRKINQIVLRKDTPAIRGMVFKIIHCLEVKII